MPYQRDENLRVVDDQPACIHLRSKAMYVTGQLEPTHPDEMSSHAQNCWCNKTQHTIGPDENEVARDLCVSGRGCFINTIS